jgi:hypothetical protein
MGQPQRKEDSATPHESFANRPVETARHGNVEIAIWRNEGGSGDFYSASAPTIRYKEGDQWKDGSIYKRHDPLVRPRRLLDGSSSHLHFTFQERTGYNRPLVVEANFFVDASFVAISNLMPTSAAR